MARDLKLQVVLNTLDRASKPLRALGRTSVGVGQQLRQSREQLKGLQAQQSDISSFRRLQNATSDTGRELQNTRDKVKALQQELVRTEQPSKALRQEFQAAVRATTQLKAQHERETQQLQELRTRLNSAGIGAHNLSSTERDLQQRISQTNSAISEQEGRLRRLTAQQERLARAKQQYERTQGLAASMAGQGAAGLATGTGILYSGARMLAPGLDFDASMSKVQALARLQKDSPELAALRTQARQLGASTQFTAGQAADAQSFLAMAGYNPKDIMASMPSMLDLAKAGDTDLARTADIASNILGGFNLKNSETARVADVLTKAFTTANTNLEQLGLTMKYVGPVAVEAGMSLEETAAMAGLLGNVGIQADTAGTTLRSMLLRLSAPTGEAADALKELGVRTRDAKGNIRSLPTLLAETAKAVEHLGSGQRLEYLKTIFGEEPAAGVSNLIKKSGAGEIAKYLDVVKENAGEAHKVASVMGDNLKGDLLALGSAWDDLGIQIQDMNNGPLRTLTQDITGLVGTIKGWIIANPELAATLTRVAVGAGALMVVMGGLTLVLASLLGPFAVFRYGLALTGSVVGKAAPALLFLGKKALPLIGNAILWIGRALLTSPIGWAIGLLAGAAYLIYKNWEPIASFFTDLWGTITSAFTAARDQLSASWDAVSGYFTTGASNMMSSMSTTLLSGWNNVVSGLSSLWSDLNTDFVGTIGKMGQAIINWSPEGLMYKAFQPLMGWFGIDLPEKFTEFGGNIMQGIANGITSKLSALKDSITGAGDSMIGWFKDKLGIHSPSRVFADLGGWTMAGLAQGLLSNAPAPLKALGTTANNLIEAGRIALDKALPQLTTLPPVTFDRRAPLQARSQAMSIDSHDTIQIIIQPPQGADVAAIARMVNAALDDRERKKQARARGTLHDRD